jgi:hypothetical protein
MIDICVECGVSEVCEEAEAMANPKQLCLNCLNEYFSDRQSEHDLEEHVLED